MEKRKKKEKEGEQSELLVKKKRRKKIKRTFRAVKLFVPMGGLSIDSVPFLFKKRLIEFCSFVRHRFQTPLLTITRAPLRGRERRSDCSPILSTIAVYIMPSVTSFYAIALFIYSLICTCNEGHGSSDAFGRW